MEISDMEWLKMRKDIDLVKSAIENEFERRYTLSEETTKIYHADGKIFHTDGHGDISLDILNWENESSIVIEYDDAEDGDQFFQQIITVLKH